VKNPYPLFCWRATFQEKPMRTIRGLLSVGLLLVASSAVAEDYWSYKDWHVSIDKDRCRIATGGDGNDVFSLAFSKGGVDASAQYEPLLIRGYPSRLAVSDSLILIIDGKEHRLGDEMLIHEGQNEWNEYFIAASLPSGMVPELVSVLGAASTLELRKELSNPPDAMAIFSLSGFTATLLKAAEWCSFDAKNLPTP
jgi:hypothetical protein